MYLNRTRSLAAATALGAALTLGVAAEAGTLQLRDGADLLTADQEASLRSDGARYPFDVRVLTDTRFATRGEFERYVSSQLVAPGMVAVGVDPVHRWTAVHFGTGTRIATSRFSAIENAGDPFFRNARWGDGIAAILGAAQSSAGVAVDERVTEGARSTGFPWPLVFVGLFVMGGIALASRFFGRRREAQGYGQEYVPSTGYPVGGNGWGPARDMRGGYGPGYGGPGYGPGYGSPGSSMGTGIAGAALGGLAGYAIGNAMANRDEHPSTHAGFGGSDASSSDAGGSSSGWDDGGGGGGDFGGGGDGGGGGDW